MKKEKKIFLKCRKLNFSKDFTERINKAYKYFKRSDLKKMMKHLNKINSLKDEIKPFIYNVETVDKGAFSIELDYIEKLIKMLKFNYENDGETILKDEYYDKMLEIYKIYRIEPIEGQLVTEKAEAVSEHKFPMLKGTLDKCKYILDEGKGQSVQKFLEKVLFCYKMNNLNEDLIISLSLKYDGTSIVLEIDPNNGIIKDAITRGKNNKGVSLKKLFKGKYINAANDYKINAVQCELMISNEDINAYSLEKQLNGELDKPYRNSRGSVTSIITSLTGYKYAKYLDPVPLRVIYQGGGNDENIDYPPEVIAKCKISEYNKKPSKNKIPYKYKNIVFTKEVLDDLSDYHYKLMLLLTKISTEINLIAMNRNKLPFAIDGVVISVLNKSIQKKMGRKGEINQWQIAYKFKSEEQIAKLLDVTYSVNRTGLVIPKAIYTPLIFNGTTQTKATLASREFMNKQHLRIGDNVIISYSNDVIPYFVGVDSHSDNPELEFPKKCPACNHKLIEDGAHSFCVNPTCPPKMALQFTNFIKVLGFRDFSQEFINRLIDNNLINSFEDILHLDEKTEELRNIEGIGEKKISGIVDKLYKLKNTEKISEDVLFNALGVSGPKISKNILSAIPYMTLVRKPNELLNVTVIGVEESKKDYIDKIKILNEKGEMERIYNILKPLSCKKVDYKYKVCFTGFRDKDLEKKLNEKSVEVVNGLKNVAYLVVPNITHISRKVEEANKKDIDIIND